MLDFRPPGYVIGLLIFALGVAMLAPVLVDVAEGSANWRAFAFSGAVSIFVGGAMAAACRDRRATGLSIQQAFMLTSGAWFILPAFGALPFVLGEPGVRFVDAFFEAMSGLTTTGSTVFSELEMLPKGVLLWRARQCRERRHRDRRRRQAYGLVHATRGGSSPSTPHSALRRQESPAVGDIGAIAPVAAPDRADHIAEEVRDRLFRMVTGTTWRRRPALRLAALRLMFTLAREEAGIDEGGQVDDGDDSSLSTFASRGSVGASGNLSSRVDAGSARGESPQMHPMCNDFNGKNISDAADSASPHTPVYLHSDVTPATPGTPAGSSPPLGESPPSSNIIQPRAGVRARRTSAVSMSLFCG